MFIRSLMDNIVHSPLFRPLFTWQATKETVVDGFKDMLVDKMLADIELRRLIGFLAGQSYSVGGKILKYRTPLDFWNAFGIAVHLGRSIYFPRCPRHPQLSHRPWHYSYVNNGLHQYPQSNWRHNCDGTYRWSVLKIYDYYKDV